MIRIRITIQNRLGLHARAAAKLVALASRFSCGVEIAKGEKVVNGKSIMGVMMLAANQGTEVELIFNGEDEEEASLALTNLIHEKFGEEN